MKTFTMVCDEAQQAIARIGAQAIADGERARAVLGQRLAEDQRQYAATRAAFVGQQTIAAIGFKVFKENQQALRAIEAQTLARVRQIAAEIAREN